MKFLPILTSLVAAVSIQAADPIGHITWDVHYGSPTFPLSEVSCSNGPNGLLTRGFTTVGQLPSFPRVGGFTNATWGSALCGSCFKLTYQGTSIFVTVIDYTADGFNLAYPAFQQLTHGTGAQLPAVDAAYVSVPASFCGL